MIVRTGTGESRVFDFRKLHLLPLPEMFKENPNLSKLTGTAVAVPGEIRGFFDAHTKFGRLPWPQLIEPSIKLCEEGFLTRTSTPWSTSLKNTLIGHPP